jgi:hypothetical protein
MDLITYNHKTGGCAAKFHVDGGGLSASHTNFGGGCAVWVVRARLVSVGPILSF